MLCWSWGHCELARQNRISRGFVPGLARTLRGTIGSHGNDGQGRAVDSLLIVFVFFVALVPTRAQQNSGTQIANPCLGAMGNIGERAAFAKPKELPAAIQQTLGQENLSPDSYFVVAEMMKRLGDYRASSYYEKAIQADPDEPCYESFYADYLRNFRGAGTPLFPSAERHYFGGLRKIQLRNGASYRNANQEIENYIDRGLSALYHQDGVVLLNWTSEIASTGSFLERPYLFLTTIDRYAQATADLDREADIRDYSSEELFSESAMRLDRPLTTEELRRLRKKLLPSNPCAGVEFPVAVKGLFRPHYLT